MEKIDFFTIGYSGKTVDRFIAALKIAGVKTLVDVRKNPVSRWRPSYSKRNLERILRANGIRYVHRPKLGIPPEIRAKLVPPELFEWYDRNVLPNLWVTGLDDWEWPIAFMCAEADPRRCHRHRIALALAKRRGLKYADL